MFYVQGKTKNGKPALTKICKDNVITFCPYCDEEFNVDLSDYVGKENFDLENTAVLCDVCAKKHSYKVTLDGISLLCDVLGKAGYGELLSDLFNEFEIESLDELTPNQYEIFAAALTQMATGGSQDD